MGGAVVIGRGGCLTGVLVAGAVGAGAAAQIPDALRGLVEQPEVKSARVVRVIDGDTMLVTTRTGSQRVRLLGIDTPEATQCGGRLATRATRSWVTRNSAKVKLTPDRLAPGRDRYGRLLAHVRNSGGRDLARWLMRRGLARTVSYQNRPLAAHPRLLALEGKARAGREGLWSKCPGWARKHAIPFAIRFASLAPGGHGPRGASQQPPAAMPMAALLAVRGAVW